MTTKILSLLFSLVFAGALFAAPAFPQNAATDPTSTVAKYVDQATGTSADDAVRIALQSNDDLLAMKNEAEAAGILVSQAAQRERSMIGFETRQQVGGGRNRSMVMGSIPLELGGRRGARTEVARREAEFAQKVFEEKERLLAADVREKFGKALAKAYKLKLTEDVLRFVTESYELVRENVKEGDKAPLDENMMLVELNRLRSMREKDEGDVRIAILELKNLMGAGPETPLVLKGDFENLVEPLPSLRVATEVALERRSDLLVLRASEAYAEARIEQSKSEGRIDASLNLGYERMTEDFPGKGDHMAIFGFSIRLPYWNGNRDAIEAAALDKQAAEKRLAFGELVVKREVASAFARYEFAVKALEIFRVGVTGEAFRNLEVIRQTYEFGGSTLIDYLGEQRRYVDYQTGLIDAQLEVYLSKVEMMKVGNEPGLR
jgi:cobalt-zinc-cadmium efflux system outer membrane protein